MSGRHRHDAFGVSFEYLSCKPFGNLFTVADDKQPCGYTVRSLPGIPDGYQYAFLPARPFDVEAGGIFGSIKQQVEIIDFELLLWQPVNARESNKIRLKFFNAFILMQIIVYYFVFPNLGVMPMNISKLMPGMGRDNTERYSSSNRLLMLPFSDRSAHRKESCFPVSRYS